MLFPKKLSQNKIKIQNPEGNDKTYQGSDDAGFQKLKEADFHAEAIGRLDYNQVGDSALTLFSAHTALQLSDRQPLFFRYIHGCSGVS